MKKRICIITLFLLTLLILVFLANGYIPKNKHVNAPILEANGMGNEITSYGNKQFWRYNNEVYFIDPAKISFQGTSIYLCKLSGTTVQKIKRLYNCYFFDTVGASGKYFYYWRADYNDKEQTLYCYNVENNETTAICTGQTEYSSFFQQDGSVYIRCSDENKSDSGVYLHVIGNVLEGIIEEDNLNAAKYSFGNTQFTEKRAYLHPEIWCCTDNTETYRLPLQESNYCEIIPFKESAFIHNFNPYPYTQTLLYYISPDGTVSEFFTTESAYTKSTLCIAGDYAFFSLQRMDTPTGDKGFRRFDNDVVTGTYRIDLSTLETIKINDSYYYYMEYIGDGIIATVKCADEHGSKSLTKITSDGSETLISDYPIF